jgi:hypothetical protein
LSDLKLNVAFFQIHYMLDQHTECEKSEIVMIDVVKPFEAVAKFFTQKFTQVTKAYTREPFVVMLELKCLSPWPLAIETTKLELVQ